MNVSNTKLEKDYFEMKKMKKFKNPSSNIGIKKNKRGFMAARLEYNELDTQDSKILVALSDINIDFIFRLISSDRNMDVEKIEEHVEIDNNFLEESIRILKNANLISNKKIEIEPGNTRRIFNATSLGQDVLAKLK